MKAALGFLIIAALCLAVNCRLLALLRASPDLYAAWLLLMAASVPVLLVTRRKWERGDFDR